jgi:acyl-[acyl-carrier-protein]-phospholipid O-acyltransferase/long-chain-fatty-acid--[acyl-carrier-protein] ligase
MSLKTMPTKTSPPLEPSRGIVSVSFLGLLATQFLGATNDSLFRWLVVPIGMHYVGEEYASMALSAGLACFVLPYILLAAPAGYLADRFSKRSVIISCKLAELVIMTLGIGCIYIGSPVLLFIIVAMLGCQSALFGPAKLGSIPEMLRRDHISTANGLVGLTTVLAIIIGTVGGYKLFAMTAPDGRSRLWISALVVLGISLLGWLTSWLIARLPAADPRLPFPKNMLRQTFADLKTLRSGGPLFRVALASAFFWSLASLAQVNVDVFGATELELVRDQVGPLMGILALGVGVGSVLAGVLSRGRIELGLVPLAATMLAVCSMLMFVVPDGNGQTHGPGYFWTCVCLFLLGSGAGMFDVPLAAYLQDRSPPQVRGAILAASNFITFSGMLLSAGVFSVLRAPLGPGGSPLFSARGIFLLAGCLTVPVAVYAFTRLPQATIRLFVWLLSMMVYKIRVRGLENLPTTRGALLTANHVSWLDGILVMLVCQRPVHMIVEAQWVAGPIPSRLARMFGAIPIVVGDRKSVIQVVRYAQDLLREGALVCIFPEGGITRSGQLQAFQPGLLTIVRKIDVPVIPVFLDGLWGSIFSFYGGKFFWKWPRAWRYPIHVLFGDPIENVRDVHQVRQAVQDLGVAAVEQRETRKWILPRLMLRACRRSMFRMKVADSTGMQLTGGSLLMRMLIFRRILLREVLSADERYVGLLLPPSVAGVLANTALPLCGRVSVNLNYTVSSEVMSSCLRQCGIRHVLTSRKVMQKLSHLKFDANLVYLEDFKEKVTLVDKLVAAASAYLLPAFILERLLGLTKAQPDDLLTVMFTSGSTGQPKGVMLSHRNVGANIDAIDELVQLTRQDVLLGILPFFHAFGYTTTLWTVLTLDPKGIYHFSPLDAHQIGELAEQHGATILISTPTFLRSYLRRCEAKNFSKLDLVLAGAEKLPRELCESFEEKFKVRPVEGYGATELSPLAAVNIPPSRAHTTQLVAKEGTVGRPIPGCSAKVTHLDTGEELGTDQSGMLWISGPNVMRGYMHQPELTAKVIRDGWYMTGDVAQIDADGFIKITGRQSRFSKIGGEMVPHIKIEESLQQILAPGAEEIKAVVTGVPDPRKGERLVVMHTKLDKSPDQIIKCLAAAGLPNLWIPSADSFCEVAEIPVLGTGKLDLKGLQDLALQKFGGATSSD